MAVISANLVFNFVFGNANSLNSPKVKMLHTSLKPKVKKQILWVQMMNNIANQARKIVYNEIIYN